MKRMLTLLPLLIYFLALNPWFMPDQSDEIGFYLGGLSMAESGVLMINDRPIVDLPPGLPTCLALVFTLGLDEIFFGKLVVIGFILAGLFLIPRFLEKEERPYPHLSYAIVLMLPICMLSGTQILAEWPYMVLSIAFLYSLRHLRLNKPDWPWAVVSGILLGAAALTWFPGVLLLVAVVAQWIRRAKKNRKLDSRLLPEIFVGIIGSVLWLAWKMRCDDWISKGLTDAPSAYSGLPRLANSFSQIDPIGLIIHMDRSLFPISKFLEQLGAPGFVTVLFSLIVFGFVAFGFVHRVRAHEIQPADWYVLSGLLFLVFAAPAVERNLVPFMPFLVGYILHGVKTCSKRTNWIPAVVPVWMCGLLVNNAYLLTKGHRQHAGLSPLVTRDAESFYKNEWRDLYRASMHLDARLPPGPIGVVDPHGRFLLAFADRTYKPYHHPGIVGILVFEDQDVPEDPWLADKSFGSYTLYIPGTSRLDR